MRNWNPYITAINNRIYGKLAAGSADISGSGTSDVNSNMRPEKAVITPPQISMETRAQFFRRSRPMQVKMPKIATPAMRRRIAMSMDLAKGGIAVELVDGIIANPAMAPSVPRIINRLNRIPTMAAATTELDGPEGFMAQLYTIFRRT